MMLSTKTITSGASMAALALILAFLPLSIPFPPIPYLRIDPAEIPVFISLLGFGPWPALITNLVYYFVLLAVGEFTPVGPTMKFLAVASSLLGFWLGSRMVYAKGFKPMLAAGTFLGTVLRVLAMTAANYVVLLILFPDFLSLATSLLGAFLGVDISSGQAGFFLVLVFTAVYNVLHMGFSLIPTILLLKAIQKTRALGSKWTPWMIQASTGKRQP
ncbi:conserved hypothetical protein [Candidatus Caldarchaeum subterraneum]|uniref:ECF transporter S component n=1 Tax=Caldiarchaeum subterraneum TaxID=311458 RepID=E6N5N9_CALS0|nr:conserved hypothetical protein [Candidatus Caldarchaeum subterraneum]BAJ50405.1 conserved hypothetical protein [Candidatus Caldarchaeum subterraneum]